MASIPSRSTIQSWQDDLGKTVSGLLGDSAESLLGTLQQSESPQSITNEWQNLYATPAMQMWQNTIAPLIREGYNLPGSFYSRSTSQGLAKSATEFYNQNVTPTLFSALESFKNRQVQMDQIYANILGLSTGLATAKTEQSFLDTSSWQQDFAAISQGVSGYLNAIF